MVIDPMKAERCFINSIEPEGILSFGRDTGPIKLGNLNVLIGANGAGKSNLLELVDFLHAIPKDIAGVVRDGGGIREWMWKGEPRPVSSRLILNLNIANKATPLRYELAIAAQGERLEVIDERLEDCVPSKVGADKPYFYYQFQNGRPVINSRSAVNGKATQRQLNRDTLDPQQSVLAQRKDPDAYPELTEVARQFDRIFTFREWRFGRYTALRQPQQATGPTDKLEADGSNLGLILNQIEHSDVGYRLNTLLSSFLPRFNHYSVRITSGTVQVFLHEKGLSSPVPATRLSDGTIRFLALLTMLLKPEMSPFICIEEPELGLHPDAIVLLARLLKEASQRTQILLTTHSDILLSELAEPVENVLVCENLGNATKVRRLNSEALEAWLDEFTLGETWRNGAIGGNP